MLRALKEEQKWLRLLPDGPLLGERRARALFKDLLNKSEVPEPARTMLAELVEDATRFEVDPEWRRRAASILEAYPGVVEEEPQPIAECVLFGGLTALLGEGDLHKGAVFLRLHLDRLDDTELAERLRGFIKGL
jgi:hypothetical protein